MAATIDRQHVQELPVREISRIKEVKMNNNLLTIFNNRCEPTPFLSGFVWRIPQLETSKEIEIPFLGIHSYHNISKYDWYSPYEEIAAVPDAKQPARYKVLLTPRPGWEEPKFDGFSLLLYNNTPRQVEIFSASWGCVGMPYQIPVRVYGVSPFSPEAMWAEKRFGEGQVFVKRSGEDLARIEQIIREKRLHPLTSQY